MKVNKLQFCGVVERYSNGVELLKQPGDCVIVERGVPRSVLIRCPDGCGDTISVNLDRRSGPAWRKYERKGKITLYPSVWKQDGCRAHFIVWNDEILWCGPYGATRGELISEDWIASVLASLPTEAIDYRVLAERLDAVPWDVYWACEELVRRHQAANGKQKDGYLRIPGPCTQGRINVRI